MKDAKTVEAKIARSDGSSVYVVTDEAPEELAIPWDEISDIDHPGNVVAAICTPFAVLGMLAIIIPLSGEFGCPGCGLGAEISVYTGIAVGVPNLVAATWGWITWAVSRSAAMPPEEPTNSKIGPVTLTDGVRTYLGIGVSWVW